MPLTNNEIEMMKSFATCEMNCLNGGPVEDAQQPSDLATYVWLDERAPHDMTVDQRKGVLSSLVQKGMVTVCTDPDGDYLDFTDEGFAAVKEMFS